MKHLYFVRHAEPDFHWEDDSTRPLSVEGVSDCAQVTEALCHIAVDRFVSSPYRRSIETIKDCAIGRNMDIAADERLRERERGILPNSWDIIKKRWDDFDFHEEGGESLRMVQKRNIAAVLELLQDPCHTIVIGTHGTALGTILNYFYPSFGFLDFKRIIDFMPYIIRLDFEGLSCVGKEELCIVEKPFVDPNKNNVVIRALEPSEIPEALRLVWDTFVEFEAPDYVPEGVNKFRECIDDSEYVGALTFYGAFLYGLLTGVIATRNGGHVAMFFVRKEYQRRGIGKMLFDYILRDFPGEKITVNAAPYGVDIYRRLGFVNTGSEQTKDGIRYTPMEYTMNKL